MDKTEMLNYRGKTVKDDLVVSIKQGDKLSIAAACFSIYAYQALKKQLDGIAELRFIFTSRLSYKKELPKKSVSSTFPASIVSVHSTVRNLK